MAARNSKAAQAESTPTTDAPATETAEAAPIDLSAFQTATAAAIKDADESTGTIPEKGLADTLKAYRELPDTRSKNAARSWLDDETKAAVMAGNILGARSNVEIKENLSSGSSKSSAPKDPTEQFVAKVAALSAAFTVVSGSVPEGVADNWVEQYETKAAELVEQTNAFLALPADADDSEVGADVKKVAKLAATTGGSGRTYNGQRRSVNAHLEQVFADKEVGAFITVTELAKADSEEYGDDHPTTGAVSARLFPPSGKASLPAGIEAVVPEDGSARGARKVA